MGSRNGVDYTPANKDGKIRDANGKSLKAGFYEIYGRPYYYDGSFLCPGIFSVRGLIGHFDGPISLVSQNWRRIVNIEKYVDDLRENAKWLESKYRDPKTLHLSAAKLKKYLETMTETIDDEEITALTLTKDKKRGKTKKQNG